MLQSHVLQEFLVISPPISRWCFLPCSPYINRKKRWYTFLSNTESIKILNCFFFQISLGILTICKQLDNFDSQIYLFQCILNCDPVWTSQPGCSENERFVEASGTEKKLHGHQLYSSLINQSWNDTYANVYWGGESEG